MSDDYIPKDPAALLGFLNQIDEEGIRVRNQWAPKWESNVKIMRGSVTPDGAAPLFCADLISPAVRRKSGLLIESKPQMDIKVRANGLQVTAKTLRMVIRGIWDEENVPMSLEELANYFGPFGSGFFEIGYDQYADYGEGAIVVAPKDPRLILVDPSVVRSYELDKAQYIREESVVPLGWVLKRFPNTGKDVQPDTNLATAGNDQHKISWVKRALVSMFKRNSDGGIESAVPRVYLRKYWLADPTEKADGTMKYPGGRLVFRTGDDVILNPDAESDEITAKYGQQNPYFDGLQPYEMLDNTPDMDHPWGHAEVEALKKINEAFNRVGNTTVSTLVKNLEWVIADNNSLSPEDINDLKQLQAVVLEKQPGRSVERVPPTQPTGTNMDFMRLMISLTEMQAGLSDGAMQGKGRVELRSQPQLEGLQQVAQVLIRAQCRRMEAFLERCGQKLISRVFQFYTDDRIMTYVDKDQLKEWSMKLEDLRGEVIQQAMMAKTEEARKQTEQNIQDGKSLEKALVKPETLSVEEIEQAIRGAWKLFRFKIVPFSSLASTRMARAGVMQELASQQLIPPSLVLEEAGFDNYEEMMKKFQSDMKIREALGLPPPNPQPGGKKKK